MVLDRIKSLPWWGLLLLGMFGIPYLLAFIRRAV